MATSAVASAPGKVLVVGGYLVLQEGIQGYVVSTSSRFHARVEWGAPGGAEAGRTTPVSVLVRSPQFHDAWAYALEVRTPYTLTPLSAKADGAAKRNPYVEYAVEVALAAASAAGGAAALGALFTSRASAGQALHVLLEADNDFYSQRQHLVERGLPVSRASLASLPARNPCPRDPTTHTAVIRKTGLGSSAALVTSLTGAVLALLGAYTGRPSAPLVHTCAQVSHGLAQGKIGSGFDVSSATYGSVAYSRLPPGRLRVLMDEVEGVVRGGEGGEEGYASLGATLLGLDSGEGEGGWTYAAHPFCLPPGLALALADVAGGSETPGMVRVVLGWRERGEGGDEADAAIPSVAAAMEGARAALFPHGLPREGDSSSTTADPVHSAYRTAVGPHLWRLLAAANAGVAGALAALGDCAGEASSRGEEGRAAYHAALAEACGVGTCVGGGGASSSSSSVSTALSSVRTSFALSRALLRGLGVAAGVHVEPPVQSQLADATLAVPGVVAAGVPGAGGYDALFAVIVDTPAVRAAVEGVWLGWPGGGLTPLLLTDGPGRGAPGAGILVTTS